MRVFEAERQEGFEVEIQAQPSYNGQIAESTALHVIVRPRGAPRPDPKDGPVGPEDHEMAKRIKPGEVWTLVVEP